MSVHPTKDARMEDVSTPVTDHASVKLARSVRFWTTKLYASAQQDVTLVCPYASRIEDVPEIKPVSIFNARTHVKAKCVLEILPVLWRIIKPSASSVHLGL